MLFLVINNDITYKIAFIIGLISFIAPIIVYSLRQYSKRNLNLNREINNRIQFKDIFPEKAEDDARQK